MDNRTFILDNKKAKLLKTKEVVAINYRLLLLCFFFIGHLTCLTVYLIFNLAEYKNTNSELFLHLTI